MYQLMLNFRNNSITNYLHTNHNSKINKITVSKHSKKVILYLIRLTTLINKIKINHNTLSILNKRKVLMPVNNVM